MGEALTTIDLAASLWKSIKRWEDRRGSESRITWIPKDRLDHYRRSKQLVDCLSCLLLEFLRVALTDATLMMRPLYYACEYRPQASRREDDTEGLKQAVRNVRLICL